MRNLIKKILRENFDWVSDIPEKNTIDWMELAAEVYTGKKFSGYDTDDDPLYEKELTEKEVEEGKELLLFYIADKLFSDLEYVNGKVILTTSGWEDCVDLFEDSDSQYGYMGRSLAKAVLGEDWYEPYYNLVQDFIDQVWDNLSDENVRLVIDNIKGFKSIGYDGEVFEVTDELINTWLEDGELGEVVRNSDDLHDIKSDLISSYESAYNRVVGDQIYSSATDAIKDLLGPYEWGTKEHTIRGEVKTYEVLRFDITSDFSYMVDAFFKNHCDFEYNRECDFEYSTFLGNIEYLLREDWFADELNPRYHEYPDYRELNKMFNEYVKDYL